MAPAPIITKFFGTSSQAKPALELQITSSSIFIFPNGNGYEPVASKILSAFMIYSYLVSFIMTFKLWASLIEAFPLINSAPYFLNELSIAPLTSKIYFFLCSYATFQSYVMFPSIVIPNYFNLVFASSYYLEICNKVFDGTHPVL